jgi:hypothetical protein
MKHIPQPTYKMIYSLINLALIKMGHAFTICEII